MERKYHLYYQSILKFLHSVIIKSDPFVTRMNERYANELTIDLNDPTTFPYYINLNGEYHAKDDPIYITDFTSKSQILLTKDSVSNNVNRNKYLLDFSLFKDLLYTYPTQKHLIKSIFFPIRYTQQEAINASNFTLLGYDKTLLDQREQDNIIFDLIKFLEYYDYRWNIKTFEYEELYDLAQWSILWTILPLFLLTKKISYTKTGNVDDFHLWEYLISKGLEDYTGYLTSKQNLYFYRNINFLIGNLGKILVTDSLDDTLLKPIGLKLQSKWIYHDLINAKENAHWNPISTNKDIHDNEEILRRDTFETLLLDIENNDLDTDRYPAYKEEIEKDFTFTKYNHLITKYQEIITTLKDFKYTQFYVRFVFDIMFYLFKNDRIDYNINIISDVDNDIMLSIDVQDVINLLYYSYYKKEHQTPVNLPTLYSSTIGINTLERPVLQDEFHYQNEIFKISDYIDIDEMLDMITYLDPVDKFTDKDTLSEFINLRYDLWIQLIIQKRNSFSRFKKYAMDNLINQMSLQETIEINSNLETYEDYFTLKPYIKNFILEYDSNVSLYDNLIYQLFGSFVNVHENIQNYLISSGQKDIQFNKMKQLFVRFNSYLIRLLDNTLTNQEYITLPSSIVSLGEMDTLIEYRWNYPSKGMIIKIEDSEVALVITSLDWDNDNHEEQGTYDLTINTYGPAEFDIEYLLECDDSNVLIVQDGVDDNIFHVTYPDYSSDTTVNYTATVTNNKPDSDSKVESKLVTAILANPVIDSFVWDDNNHEEQETYELTITAHDPQSQDLTYDVVCDDGNVTIVQDGVDETIFHVTYPDYASDTTVTYTITVTNEDLLTDVETDAKLVTAILANPVIDSFVWDDNNHEEQETYELTITAHDPQSQDLTYDVVCDDGNVIITQGGEGGNVFYVTYPDYASDTTVNYTITVTNEDLLTDVETDAKLVTAILANPIIDSFVWDDNSHEEQSSYELTINAHDPQGQDLTYDVVCDDGNVIITQGGEDGNVFYITYPDYASDTTVNYTITVTNEDLLTDVETDAKLVTAMDTGDRGVFGGGYGGGTGEDPDTHLDTIDYMTISTTGNAVDFGNLIVARYGLAACSNGTNERGIFGGGYASSDRDDVDYITISTPGNAIDFGDLTAARVHGSSTSNGTNERGIFGGGYSGTQSDIIDYVTISSPGNAINFGDLTAARYGTGATSNGTNERGVFGGGFTSVERDLIDYITISTPGNAANFGDLTEFKVHTTATSNGINDRGIFGGGYNGGHFDTIEYITISTLGNAIDFGDLTLSRYGTGATSNNTNERGVFGGGYASAEQDVIDYVTISTPGNAIDFGDLMVTRVHLAACSNV